MDTRQSKSFVIVLGPITQGLTASQHGTCPACRHTFLDVKPLSESDGESSDGDYIPGEDDYDEDEDLDIEWDLDFDDDGSGFSDELDDHGLNAWDDSSEPTAENWGLSDGDSLSEGDLTTGANEAAEVDMLLDGKLGLLALF